MHMYAHKKNENKPTTHISYPNRNLFLLYQKNYFKIFIWIANSIFKNLLCTIIFFNFIFIFY